MAAKYKLRFADGTTLAMDRDGLQTWIDRGKVDDQTSVQAPGARGWSPLRDFLAGETSGGGGRSRSGPPREDLAPLRLAPIDDDGPDPDAEMYEGEYGDSPFAVVWLWLKRLAITLVLLAGLGTAVAWWPVWLPWVTEHGVALFTAIDKKVHPERAAQLSPAAERQREEEAARQAAREQLPQLDGATLDRVMGSSMLGAALDPAEVFSRSHEAFQRGLTSLTPEQAQEARDLKGAFEAALPAAAREQLREYERMRAHRSTLPFEDRQAMVLAARAFRALPPAQQPRVQAVWARAIAAGLSP
jgi:hypothetical protein